VNILGDVNRGEGTYETAGFVVPANVTGIRVAIDRRRLGNVKRNENSDNTWDRLVAEVYLERSTDGGQTWEEHGGVGIEGGDVGWGRVSTESVLKVSFFHEHVGTGFLLRGRYIIHERLRAKVDIEWVTTPLPPLPEVHESVSIEKFVSAENNDTSTLSLPSATTSGSDKVAVFCGANAYTSGRSYSSVVRGSGGSSETFTELEDEVWGTNQGHGAHYYIAPSNANRSITVTYSGNCVGSGACWYMNGAHQTVPIDDSLVKNSTSGESISDTLTSQTDGMCVAVAQVYSAPDLEPTESGQTEDYQEDQYAGGPQIYQSGTRRTAAGATTTMGYDWTGDDYNDLVAVAVAPAAAAEEGGAPAIKPEKIALQPMTGVD
jgi:hypothetical protein